MYNLDLKNLAPLIIVVIGWVLTSLTSVISRLFENKRIRNEVVFNLLEIYHNVSKIYEIELLIKNFPGYIKRKLDDSIDEKLFQTQLGQIIKTALMQSGYFKNLIIRDDFSKIFDDSIIKLSQIDPVTAYRIRGSHNYVELTDMFEKYFQSVKESSIDTIGLNIEDEHTLNFLQDKFTEKILIDRLDFLSSYIRKISPKLNLYRYFEIVKITSKPKEKKEEDLHKELDELFKILSQSEEFKHLGWD